MAARVGAELRSLGRCGDGERVDASIDQLSDQDGQSSVTGVPDGVTVTGDPPKLTSSTLQYTFTLP